MACRISRLPPFNGMNEVQPNLQVNQTISVSESSSWIHGKHNMRYGGDLRRVHDNLFGSTNEATGGYTFTGLFTEQPGTGGNGAADSGSALGDLLLGLPQQDCAPGALPDLLFAAKCLGSLCPG